MSRLTIGYQPIVDVARGVVAGYQAQPQFPAADVPRALNISALTVLGNDVDGLLTASVATQALTDVETLPANTFLTIPLGVDVAASRAVSAVLLGGRRLDGLVLDVVGAIGSVPDPTLVSALERYRAAGARIAVGGYGVAQPELTSIVRLAPSILRLDRGWVRDIDASRSKRSAVDVIGHLAGQLDAWILAEGVSTAAELRTLSGLNVPLAQGPFVGEPREFWPDLDAHASTVLPRLRTDGPSVPSVLEPLVQPAFTTTHAAAATAVLPEASGFEVVVVLDEHDRPVTLLEHGAAIWNVSTVLAVNVNTPVSDVVQRAMSRRRQNRFTPVVATDDTGKFVGILRLERLMSHLASDVADRAAQSLRMSTPPMPGREMISAANPASGM